MADLIDRQAVRLIEIDDKSARNYRTYNLDDAYDDGFYDAISAALELPSVELEIIRCKNCRNNHWCNIQEAAMAGDNFFCGAAERRIDG